MKQFSRTGMAVFLAALVLLTVGPVQAQTVLSSTTLSSAMTDTSGRVMNVTSATGFVAPGVGLTSVVALVDREIMNVTAVTGTVISVARGSDATRATPHVSGATVTVALRSAVVSYIPAGACTRANLQYVPLIVAGSPGLGVEVGSTYDCLGVGAAGQWVKTSAPDVPIKGSAVASATSITPTGTYFTVSGTVNPVNTVVVPAGFAPGMALYLEPTAVWTTGTGGNILLGSTAVVGKVLILVWNGTKWVPSY